LKIVHINTTAYAGSTGRICGDLAEMMIADGHDVVIGYGRATRGGQAPTVKIGDNLDIYWHVLGTKILDRHGLHSNRTTKSFLRWLDDYSPDVVHIHNLHGYYMQYEVLFAYLKKKNVAVVWTLHDCWPFTGHCCYYERVDCEKWKSGCHHCPLLWLYPASLGYDGSARNFYRKKIAFNDVEKMHLAPVSKWMSAQIESSFLAEYDRTVIYNGVNQDIFRPRDANYLVTKYNLVGKKVILGVANEWSDGKGLWLFKQLAADPLPDTMIVLIGLHAKQQKELPQHVIALSRTTNQEELAMWYSLADVFVTPSKAESFGLVVAEAMSCGTPCVVNRKAAMAELVDESTGRLADDRYESYREAIIEVLRLGKQDFAKKCLDKAMQEFDLRHQLEAYKHLYIEMVS
jgi:putative colanic acid biosynthesis glycosyltransferase